MLEFQVPSDSGSSDNERDDSSAAEVSALGDLDDASPSPGVHSQSAGEFARRIGAELHKAIVGQDELVELLIVALLADGHVLLEGVPGTAKTLAVRALAHVINVSFVRIQFTPDLMPSDILGTSVFDPNTREFTFRQGPVFAGLLLADEINRTPPKTQSALLEAMEEHSVSVDGVGHVLPHPFMVCATQNPIEYEGTYPLPEAQLDRFMFKVAVSYPTAAQEEMLLERVQAGFQSRRLETVGLTSVVDAAQLGALREEVARVQVDASVQRYIVRIARATRESPLVLLGASPRAAIALLNASRAIAAARGRDFVTPDDVKLLAHPVLRHRLILRPESEVEGLTSDRIIDSVLQSIEVPR